MQFPIDQFEVDSAGRSVRHIASGIVFWFDEYRNPFDWERAGPKAYSGNGEWRGDIRALGDGAKAAAVAGGMPAFRPRERRARAKTAG